MIETQNMNDRTGWVPVTCEASNDLRELNTGVFSSLTDLDGRFGRPVMFTEWTGDDGKPMLRDYLWDPLERSPGTCEHLAREAM